MSNTLLSRMPVTELPDSAQQAWHHLKTLTGEPSFVEVFGQAPTLLNFVMQDFYQKIFFGGKVDQRYKQLVRLKLSSATRLSNLQQTKRGGGTGGRNLTSRNRRFG